MVANKIEVNETTPLRWPNGWSRTLIEQRKTQGAWKKSWVHYRIAIEQELSRMGVSSVEIARNETSKERLDPGVAVWFAIKVTDDFSWQTGLGLDNPAPSLEEIDSAYRKLAQKHHPDAGGDVVMFQKISEYRKKARAWVLGDSAAKHDNCIPCDRFTDQRQNLAAIASALRHFRGLERVGIPAILERVMQSAFKTALPANVGGSQ
jgi:hypothetical protein